MRWCVRFVNFEYALPHVYDVHRIHAFIQTLYNVHSTHTHMMRTIDFNFTNTTKITSVEQLKYMMMMTMMPMLMAVACVFICLGVRLKNVSFRSPFCALSM